MTGILCGNGCTDMFSSLPQASAATVWIMSVYTFYILADR
jgi:hypothetical protein